MDTPLSPESPAKVSKLRSFGRWIAKARKPLIVSATLLLLVGVVVFSQYSDTIIVSINRFFAFEEKAPNLPPGEGECVDANDCFALYGDPSTQGATCTSWVCQLGTCRPRPVGCNVTSTPTPTPQQHLACQNRQCVLVNGGGADQCSSDPDCDFGPQQHLACRNQQCVLTAGPGSDQCANNSDCVTATPTPTTTQTPPPGGSDPCAGRQTDEVNGVRYCVLEANFGGGVCTTNPSGTLFQRIGVSDSGPDPMHVVYIGFHDNARGCSATTSQGINVSKSGTTDYPTPHSRGTFRIDYSASRFSCGRVQLDSSFTTGGAGFGLWLGEVIDYGQNCGSTPTPPPTQHLACRNQQCVLVNGGGADQCSSDSECVTGTPTPTPTKNAVCVSHTIPANMNAGQTLPVSIVLRNTGTVTWTQQTPAQYDLTLWPWPPTTPSVSPQAMNLPVVSVPPNGTATFSFNLTAPTVPGTYNAKYRIVEQGIGWIGETCGNTITVTAAPTVTPSLTPTITPTFSATPTPTIVPIECSPKTQDVAVNSPATLVVSGGTSDQFNWTATSGNPPSGTGSTFGVSYSQAGSYQVTVNQISPQGGAGRQATCTVNVIAPTTSLACAPSSQSVIVGQVANFSAIVLGGANTSRPTWTAPGGNPTGGTGSTFSTQYFSPGSRSVTVALGSQQATCPVEVISPATPTPTPTALNPALSLSKLVRNITQNTSELDAVTANPTDTIEFVIRVVSYGNASVNNVRLTDVLPANVSYLSGSTTIDGTASSDITISGGLSLGDMAPGRTITVRFRTQVAAESAFSVGITTLTNTATATSNNAGSPSDVAFVNVTRTTGAGGTIQINLQKLGRNITRGEFGEQSSVTSFPNQTIEFIIRARSLSSTRVNNVVLRDVIPARITYVAGSTSLNGVTVGDGLVGSSGLNIGSLDPNQEAIIRFSGRVSPGNQLPLGTSTAINTVRMTADGVPEITAQLPIIIINGIAGVTQVQTGPGESLAVALAVALLVTLMYVTYTRTGTFKRRELKATIKEQESGEDKFNFKV